MRETAIGRCFGDSEFVWPKGAPVDEAWWGLSPTVRKFEADGPRQPIAEAEAEAAGAAEILRGQDEVKLAQFTRFPSAERKAQLPERLRDRTRAWRPRPPTTRSSKRRRKRGGSASRLPRYVVRASDGLYVNLRLVAVGAAAPYFYDGRRGRYAARLEALAARARAKHLGLWGACPGTTYDPYRGIDTRR